MTDFPTLSYASNSKILTLLYTWSLKKVPLLGGASPCRPFREEVAPFPPVHRLHNDKLSFSAITKCFKCFASFLIRCTDAFTHYSDIPSGQVICPFKAHKSYYQTHLAFSIFPYFLLQSHCLLITDQSEFNTHPQNEAKKKRKNVTFTCNAVGNLAPTFSWTKEGSVVNTTQRIIF